MCTDCISVHHLIKEEVQKLSYHTTPLNETTLINALEHLICYQTSSVADIPMNRIHSYIASSYNISKKCVESRLNRCKRDMINTLTTGDKWTVFGLDNYGELCNLTEHEFLLHLAQYTVNNWNKATE